MLCGWSLGRISTALSLRWGQAKSLAWAIPLFRQPAVAVLLTGSRKGSHKLVFGRH